MSGTTHADDDSLARIYSLLQGVTGVQWLRAMKHASEVADPDTAIILIQCLLFTEGVVTHPVPGAKDRYAVASSQVLN